MQEKYFFETLFCNDNEEGVVLLKPIIPIKPLKNPLNPMGMRPALNRLGSTRGDVPHNPN